MTAETIHTCSYSCERPGCIRAQRDELAARLTAAGAVEAKTVPVPTRVHLIGETAAIVGTPGRGWDEEGPEAHNCDAMGCATIGPHVLARVPFTDERALSQQPEARGVDEAMVERAAKALLDCRSYIGSERPDDPDDEDSAQWWDELTELAAALAPPAPGADDVTAETDLMPLHAELQGHPKLELIKHYARANVARAIAPLQAEIEALRAEVERVTCELMDATTRADNLEEALRLALDSHGVMLMTDPPQDAWKVRRVEEIGRALLRDQEEGHEQ